MFATEFGRVCSSKEYVAECRVLDLKDYDAEDSLFGEISPNNILVLFLSTYTEGSPPSSAAWFFKYVTEMSVDFRHEKEALRGLRYSVCGLGNSLYAEHFNTVALTVDKCFAKMKATRVAPLYCCDENTVNSKHASMEADVAYWQQSFFEKLEFYVKSLALRTADGCSASDTSKNGSDM